MANNNHFNLTLDTLAPSGSITSPHQYVSTNVGNNLSITKGDAVYMKVWFDTLVDGYAEANPQPTSVDFVPDTYYTRSGSAGSYAYTKAETFDSSATYYTRSSNYDATSIIPAATTYTTTFSANGKYYYHLILIDVVNNESAVLNTTEIIFDTQRPTVSNIVLTDTDSGSTEISNSRTVNFSFDYADIDGNNINISGVNQAIISCADWEDETITLSPSNSHYSGTLTFASDGAKTVTVTVIDRAGNSSVAGEARITIDTGIETPILTLKDSSNNNITNGYINSSIIKVQLTSTDADINGYKIWEGNTEPGSWTAYTPDGNAFSVLVASFNLTSGDGQKTIHAKVKDVAGSEKAADAVTITVDTVVPTVNISTNKSIISNVSGFTTAALTLVGSDPAGIKSYTLKCGNTIIASTLPIPSTFDLTSANSMVEGSNTITLEVTDNAGNVNSDDCTVILDTTAPTISLASAIYPEWHNTEFAVTVTLGDANAFVANQAYLIAWTDDNSSTTDPGAASAVNNISLGNFVINSTSIDWDLSQSDENYLHIKLVDNVGNVSYLHERFKYDSQIDDPVVSFSQSVYSSTSAVARITLPVSDVSGIGLMRITGDITDGTANNTWEAVPVSGNRAITLTSGDGYKHVSVQLKDAAGNISQLVQTVSPCELDTTVPTATLDLYEADGITAKVSPTPVATFSVRLSVSDDILGACEYKIYGDFTFNSQSAQPTIEPDSWTEYIPDHTSYKLIDNMYCTSGDGQKVINIKVRDNTQEITHTISVNRSFEYDTTAPEVDVTTPDYDRISKVHALRRNNGGEIAGKYADECNFTFAPHVEGEYYQAYKVVAYADEAAAEAGSYEDTPIKQIGDVGGVGSTCMHATGLNQNTVVTATICGADLEEALGGGNQDGAHIIVVYMQDIAGQWSEPADFTVEVGD